MEAYGKILVIAIPIFLVLVLFEKWWGWWRGHDTVRNMDMVSSLTSGVTNVTKDVLGLSVAVISYQWLVERVALVHLQPSVWLYVIAFVALDLSGYMIHRLQHRVNFFWNAHLVHHSSEDFNLACALRQSISTFFKLFTVFLLPAALLGVPGKVISVVAPLHLFAQFWYHTEHIGKMGWLEKIIVTPSHHRVHHAINKEYIDKNYGQIFIIWDKLFGSFQEELPGVPAVYGITRPVQTWNPIKINFMHLWLLIKDAWRTRKLEDKLKIWFMPTGWRPQDVTERYPLHKIEDVYHFEKYNTWYSWGFGAWAWFQLMFLLMLVTWLFGNIAAIGSPSIFVYGVFIFLFVYALTETMDGSRYAILWELAKCVMGIAIIYRSGDWFGTSKWSPTISYWIIGLLIASMISTAYFSYQQIRQRNLRLTSL